MSKRRFSLLAPLARLWREKLTMGGRAAVAGMVLAAHGTVSVAYPHYQIFSVLLAMLCVTALVGWLLRPRVEIHIRPSAVAVAGERLALKLTVRNLRSRPLFNTAVELIDPPETWRAVEATEDLPFLSSKQASQLQMYIRPLLRGVYAWPRLRVVSTFPCNLFRYTSEVQPQGELLVLPSYQQLPGVMSRLAAGPVAGETADVSRSGESLDYLGNRDYVPGMSIRRLDWRSWARLSKPVVREYHGESQYRSALLVDTLTDAAEQTDEPFEAAISLAAATADALYSEGLCVDYLVLGDEVHVLGDETAVSELNVILELLACVRGSSAGDQSAPAAPRDQLEGVSVLYAVLSRWDARRWQLCRELGVAGRSLKVLLIDDDPTFETREEAPDEMIEVIRFHSSEVRRDTTLQVQAS